MICPDMTGDHPRSRGVYAHRTTRDIDAAGSSPLARGLRRRRHRAADRRGIIPARAGFTCTQYHGNYGATDHPRSRGVYRWCRTRPMSGRGSSPLARGLPGDGPGCRVPGGIIPARAGFTRPPTAAAPPSWDHPRSRGVYLMPSTSFFGMAGSSPLARGLQGHRVTRMGASRIIPARAGFTFLSPSFTHFRRDHPRSRGVYRYQGRI